MKRFQGGLVFKAHSHSTLGSRAKKKYHRHTASLERQMDVMKAAALEVMGGAPTQGGANAKQCSPGNLVIGGNSNPMARGRST